MLKTRQDDDDDDEYVYSYIFSITASMKKIKPKKTLHLSSFWWWPPYLCWNAELEFKMAVVQMLRKFRFVACDKTEVSIPDLRVKHSQSRVVHM